MLCKKMIISYLSYVGKERGKDVWGLICNCWIKAASEIPKWWYNLKSDINYRVHTHRSDVLFSFKRCKAFK